MRLKRIFTDKTEREGSSLDQVVEEINTLDGKKNTVAMFFIDGPEANLSVAGGNDGRYIVDVTYGIDESFYSLLSRKPSSRADEDELYLVSGGQGVTRPAFQVVDRETATRAALYWAEHGKMDPSLIWEKAG